MAWFLFFVVLIYYAGWTTGLVVFLLGIALCCVGLYQVATESQRVTTPDPRDAWWNAATTTTTQPNHNHGTSYSPQNDGAQDAD